MQYARSNYYYDNVSVSTPYLCTLTYFAFIQYHKGNVKYFFLHPSQFAFFLGGGCVSGFKQLEQKVLCSKTTQYLPSFHLNIIIVAINYLCCESSSIIGAVVA